MPGQDDFERRCRRRCVVTDVEGHEGEGFVGGSAGGRLLVKEASPGVEGGFGQVVAPAEVSDGQAAMLPAFEELPPVLFLAGIAGFALWHG
jgi:hypothetical protein